MINRGTKKGEELRRRLTLKTFAGVTPSTTTTTSSDDGLASNFSLSSVSEDLKRATAEKDRLLDYQQNRFELLLAFFLTFIKTFFCFNFLLLALNVRRYSMIKPIITILTTYGCRPKIVRNY